MTPLAPGRYRALAPRDFPRDGIRYRVETTGPIRATNTRHGARLLVEVSIVPGNVEERHRREYFVSMKSASYVRLCEMFSEDLKAWSGSFTVEVVRHGIDRRPRVEVVGK